MPKVSLLVCCSACLASAHAEDVTRAWHLVKPPEAIRDAVSISEAPAPSVFTATGDQLKDLSKALKAEETFGKGAWIVWNETRHQLVIRGNRHTLAYADHARFLQQEHLAGITLAWYRGIGPGEPVHTDAKPTHRTSIIVTGYSGTKTNRKWEPADAGSLGEIEVDVQTFYTSDESRADLDLRVDWKEKQDGGALSWFYGGSCVTEFQGGQERIVCQLVSPTNERWTITAKVRDLLADGTPASESRWQEVDGKAVPAVYRAPETQANLLGKPSVEGLELSVGDFSINGYFTEALFEATERDAKPAPDVTERERRTALERPSYCKDAVFPDSLKEYAQVAMWDLKPLIQRLDMMRLKETDWVAYDPRLKRLLVASADPEVLNGIALLANASCASDHPNFAVTFLGGVSGSVGHPMAVGAKLVGPFGGLAQLECWDEQEKQLLSVRPSVSEGPEPGMINVLYELEFDGFRDFPALKAEGCNAQPTGCEMPIQTNESGGRKATVTAKFDFDPVVQAPKP